ncbi:MAG: gfo/Idh/MocA family oxidoreductase, partial [Casimicrobiaceae bacterium]
TYGHTGANPAAPAAHNHFGMFIASCERADLRPLPNGVMVYDDARAWLDPLAPPTVPRAEVIDELCDAIDGKRAPLHTGEWSMATLEVCLAILDSTRSGQEVVLRHQVAVPAQA